MKCAAYFAYSGVQYYVPTYFQDGDKRILTGIHNCQSDYFIVCTDCRKGI